uniref:WD_REPEATS_REGION domain-containing protein n=1 Tax=Heterorhabditis bacteriophora TaxID=37862 RepID=A0A1I7XNI1_HETBA
MLNMVSQLDKREFFGIPGSRGMIVDEDRLIQRFGHSKTLEASFCNLIFYYYCYIMQGHDGCVNTLRWNISGSILASGSDDQKVKIWRLDGSLLLTIPTGHRANVFAVEFLPAGNDQIIISAAGDHFVKMHNIETKDEPFTWSTNARVKRLATAQDDPFLFWSAAEDGYVREYDTRSNEDRKLIETASRVKSFAICQGRTEMIAVATDHSEVPIYDRRKPDTPLIICQNGNISRINYHLVIYFSLVFFQAIDIYNHALSLNPGPFDRSVLLANRAMGYLCRRWEGDSYACVRDCIEALLLCSGNSKALWRLARSLMLLEQWSLAEQCIDLFKRRFPGDKSISRLEDQGFIKCYPIYVQIKLCRLLQPLKGMGGLYKDIFDASCKVVYFLITLLYLGLLLLYFKQFHKVAVAMDSSHVHNSHVLIDEEKKIDYSERYSGHTNTHTDIKEANFFGSRNQYIDCGSLLLWERSTGILKAAWRADDSILNIVQPHPEKFMLATSGIEDVIRFWEPLAENATNERRMEDVWAHFGQRRRNPSEAEQFFRVMGARMMNINRVERPECITS